MTLLKQKISTSDRLQPSSYLLSFQEIGHEKEQVNSLVYRTMLYVINYFFKKAFFLNPNGLNASKFAVFELLISYLNDLLGTLDRNVDIQYIQWVTYSSSLPEFMYLLIDRLEKLTVHSSIATAQSTFLKKRK